MSGEKITIPLSFTRKVLTTQQENERKKQREGKKPEGVGTNYVRSGIRTQRMRNDMRRIPNTGSPSTSSSGQNPNMAIYIRQSRAAEARRATRAANFNFSEQRRARKNEERAKKARENEKRARNAAKKAKEEANRKVKANRKAKEEANKKAKANRKAKEEANKKAEANRKAKQESEEASRKAREALKRSQEKAAKVTEAEVLRKREEAKAKREAAAAAAGSERYKKQQEENEAKKKQQESASVNKNKEFNNEKEKLRKLIQNDMNKNPDKYDRWRETYGVTKYMVLAYIHLLYNVSKHNVPPTNRKNVEKIARSGMLKTHPNKGGTNRAASQAATAKNMLLKAHGFKSSS